VILGNLPRVIYRSIRASAEKAGLPDPLTIVREMDVNRIDRNPESIRATRTKMMPLLRYDQLTPARCATRS
jgi:hypothetical protein